MSAREWSDWYRREDPTAWVLPQILRERAERMGDAPYYRYEDGEWIGFAETNLRADRVANGLRALGVEHGDSISVMLPNCEQFLPIWFGILKAGGVMSPINTAYKGEFLAWPINLVESRLLVIADRYLDRLSAIKGQLARLERVVVVDTADAPVERSDHFMPFAELEDAPDAEPDVTWSWTDDARIMFTSGTTGRSKGVIKQHAADYYSARGAIEAVGIEGDDTLFSCLPLFHSNAQVISAYPALIAGCRVAFAERFSGSRFWSQVIAAEATSFTSIGAMIYFLWNQPPSEHDRGHRVRRVLAAPAPKDIYEQFEARFGISFVEGYGLTETGVVTYMPPDRPPRLGSCGTAAPGYEVTIVEPDTDLPLPPDTPGEIVVDMKVPNIVMRAYYGMPEKTAEDFRNLKLHTGDLGRMDADGYVYFMDRVKDYIRRRGENVSSMEVEKIASDHPAVAEAACVGIKAGEGASSEDEILVVAVPEGEAPDADGYLRWMAERMPYFMVPLYLRFVDELPKTPTQRVQKVALREQGVTADTFTRDWMPER
jgi:crotonobetaine/carnitine-CoA ligase